MAATNWFTEHPASEGETYGEHFRVAMGFSRKLIGAGLCAAVHAVMPNLHKTTASGCIHQLHECLETGDRSAVVNGHAPAPCAESVSKAS